MPLGYSQAMDLFSCFPGPPITLGLSSLAVYDKAWHNCKWFCVSSWTRILYNKEHPITLFEKCNYLCLYYYHHLYRTSDYHLSIVADFFF